MLSTQQQQEEGNGLLDGFQVYKLPLNMSQDYIDAIDGHVHRFQNRCLGVSTLKSGSKVYPNATFYEITESEISDLSSTPEEEEQQSLDTSKLLPPKKRKRRRMIRYDIIFCIEQGQVQLTSEFVFFVLPRDAITECLTETVPHKLLFSFFPQSCGISHCGCHSYPTPVMEEGSYKTKLEEFAAVCSTSCKLTLPDQPKSDGHVNNIILTHVPIELFRAIKQMVSSYEIMCQNMMELMKLHHEKIVHHKAEIDYLPSSAAAETTTMTILPSQSEEDYHHATKNEDWSSSDEDHVKTDILPVSPPEIPSKKSPPIQQQVQQQQQKGRGNNTSNQIKKCLYCGSKSTPMWRRGPQGAGTLCNACGVKWKHGKILNGSDTVMTDVIPSTTTSTNQRRNSSNNKGEKKRKRSNTSLTGNNNKRNNNKKRNSSTTTTEYYDTFAVPAPMHPTTTTSTLQQQQWESTATSSSSTSSSRSPLESFSSSPNTSPSITTLMDQQDLKRDITSLLSFDTETLSVYVGEDAVEAAAVLTLLKRS